MAKRQTQGSEFQALDPEFLAKTREELEQARSALEKVGADRDELAPVFYEISDKWSELEEKEVALKTHIDALQVLLGERPYVEPEPPAQKEAIRKMKIGKRYIRIDEPSPNEIRQHSADAVVSLLNEVGEPLHYRDIHRELKARGRLEFLYVGGADPASTLLSRFFKDPRLYRPQRGTYALVEWLEREDRQSSDDLPDAADRVVATLRLTRGDKSRFLRDRDVLGAAERALREEGEAMHHLDLADKMIKMGKWRPIKSTPKNVVSLRLAKDIRDNGAGSRFRRFGRGVYGLREWGDDGYATSELDTEGDEHE